VRSVTSKNLGVAKDGNEEEQSKGPVCNTRRPFFVRIATAGTRTQHHHGGDRSVIGRHIRNVLAEGELARESNVQNLHIANSEKPVSLFSTGVIISIG